eukprot:scaffold27322_cov63-Phaeocystis_antarctica.AAC.7
MSIVTSCTRTMVTPPVIPVASGVPPPVSRATRPHSFLEGATVGSSTSSPCPPSGVPSRYALIVYCVISITVP